MAWEKTPNLDPMVIARQAASRMIRGQYNNYDREDAIQEGALVAFTAMKHFDRKGLPGGALGKKGYALVAVYNRLRRWCTKWKIDRELGTPAEELHGKELWVEDKNFDSTEKETTVQEFLAELQYIERPLWHQIAREILLPETESKVATLKACQGDRQKAAEQLPRHLAAILGLRIEEVNEIIEGLCMIFDIRRAQRAA